VFKGELVGVMTVNWHKESSRNRLSWVVLHEAVGKEKGRIFAVKNLHAVQESRSGWRKVISGRQSELVGPVAFQSGIGGSLQELCRKSA